MNFQGCLPSRRGEKVISSNVRNQGDSVAICQGSDCELKDSKFMKTYTWCMRWLGAGVLYHSSDTSKIGEIAQKEIHGKSGAKA